MQFISEKEVEEVKAKKQKEWEKVRRPDQPLQRPEEEIDHRTLYERLKSQRDKKQEEFEEQFKFKNMIYKGLDEDEAVFLQALADNRAQVEAKERDKEKEELLAFREAVEKLKEENDNSATTQPSTSAKSTAPTPAPTAASSSSSSLTTSATNKTQKSQLSLIAGSIKTKRKRSSVDDSATGISPEKKTKVESNSRPLPPPAPPPPISDASGSKALPVSVLEVSSTSKALTGLFAYSSSSSDSEEE